MDRRVDVQHCWFLGPIVISLGTMAQNGGVGLPWFERMVTTDAPPQDLGTRAIPVESVNHLFKSVESRLGTSAIAAWAEDAALTQTSPLSLHWGEPSIEDVVKRVAETSLLDHNIAATGTFDTADHLTIFLLPIEGTPKWVHVFFLALLAEGITKYNEDPDLVEDLGLGGMPGQLLSGRVDSRYWNELSTVLTKPSWVRFRKSALTADTVFASESWARMTRSMLNPVVGWRFRTSSWRYKTAVFFCNEIARTSELNMPKAAEFMNVDVSTLRRHLSIEGTSFRKLLAEFRMSLGHILRIQNLTDREVSSLLGFSSSASLKRLNL